MTDETRHEADARAGGRPMVARLRGTRGNHGRSASDSSETGPGRRRATERRAVDAFADALVAGITRASRANARTRATTYRGRGRVPATTYRGRGRVPAATQGDRRLIGQ